MPHITIKRPEGSASDFYSFERKPGNSSATYQGALTRVGEIRHGIQAQYLVDHSIQFPLRNAHQNHNYLQFAQAKNINLGKENDKSYSGPSKQQQLKNDKMAYKGQEAFIRHVVNYIKNAARHEKTEVSLDVAETLESFRKYRQQGSFDPHEHTRNLAVWLQSMMKGGHSNAHTIIGKAIIVGLRAAGYKNAKIETKYRKQTIKTEPEHQATINSRIFKEAPRHKTQLISLPYNVVTVSTQCTKAPNLDNLNAKTQAAIRNKTPSWIGSIFSH